MMTKFLRLLGETDKAQALGDACEHLRQDKQDVRCFEITPESFDKIPGKPFAYWVGDSVRNTFERLARLETDSFRLKQGLATADDFRFVRLWWEVPSDGAERSWVPFAKGGAHSPFYADVYLVVKWPAGRTEMSSNLNATGSVRSNIWMLKDTATDYFFRPGLTWSRRTQGGLSIRAMPANCIFADKGPCMFSLKNDRNTLLSTLAITNSRAFRLLVSLQMCFGSYEVGVLQRTPMPPLDQEITLTLSRLAHKAWKAKYTLDDSVETSHAFTLPMGLRKTGDPGYRETTNDLNKSLSEIDSSVKRLYGLKEIDFAVDFGDLGQSKIENGDEEDDCAESSTQVNNYDTTLSWAVGVCFGRFDWKLATGERQMPIEPDPFDALPTKSPGMLPNDSQPFHEHEGILVDDAGHPHDITNLIDKLLELVVPSSQNDVRHWLRRDFFPFHLHCYSKSRRKAPIYWPLTTASGSYTLWLYYPSLSSQTLYKIINDFVEPKLKQITGDMSSLGKKSSARTIADEKRLEELQALELELLEFHDDLLKLAPTYKPNLDDGVQICAAPLWKLLRHKPWQSILNETWTKLSKGDYDWSHLSMNYWPDRVLEKCKTDKSLAIAHGQEKLFIEPQPNPKKAQEKKKKKKTEGEL